MLDLDDGIKKTFSEGYHEGGKYKFICMMIVIFKGGVIHSGIVMEIPERTGIKVCTLYRSVGVLLSYQVTY